jgi:hypothetical protein
MSLSEKWKVGAMCKRLAWALFFFIPPAFIVLAICYHHAHPFESQRFKGMATDLKPAEVEDALNILVQEREMWSRFDNLSGHIVVTLEQANKERVLLAGNISLHQTDFNEKRLWVYKMTFSDKSAGWTVVTDGTHANTQIDCQNKQFSDAIEAIDPRNVLQILVFPKFALVPLFKDQLFNQGTHTVGQIIGFWNPWRNQLESTNLSHSYTFKAVESSSMGEISFAEGHFSGFHKGNIVGSYEIPVKSNGFWFPTEILFCARDMKYHITLSDITVNAANK